MRLHKKKRGNLAAGLIMLMITMFIFAIFSLLSITLWNKFDDTIQDMDNTTISPDVKEKVHGLGYLVLWGDKLFVISFLIILISFIIASAIIPVDQPIYLFIFLILLVFITIIAMILSNVWAYLIDNPNFIAAAAELKFTDYFMRYYPIIIFLTGIMGSVLFYGRKEQNDSGGGDARGFE